MSSRVFGRETGKAMKGFVRGALVCAGLGGDVGCCEIGAKTIKCTGRSPKLKHEPLVIIEITPQI